jgi:hypothetical protein
VEGIVALNCRNIGIITNEDGWEYPWWILLQREYKGQPFRLEHVEVKNLTSRLNYPQGQFIPCALLSTEGLRNPIVLPEGVYAPVWTAEVRQGRTALYIKQP